jgi:hypothetical protein
MTEDTVDAPPFYLVAGRLDLVGEVVHLIADIRAQGPSDDCQVIVIDTLNRSIQGSESDDRDMGDYIKACDAIREAFRCTVILIHHRRVDGSRPRGHTSLTGAVDAQISVKRNNAGQFVTTVEYMKDGPEGAETYNRLEPVTVGVDADGDPITSCIVQPVDGGVERTSPKKKRISAIAHQAFKVLHEAILDHPMPAPASPHIPQGVTGVTKKDWKSYLEKGGIINADGNPREQLSRIIVTLKDAGLVGAWDQFVWPVTSRASFPRHWLSRYSAGLRST